MRVIQVRAIEGPSVYNYRPVLIMRVDLEEFTERESYEYPGFSERLLAECPGLYDHYCAMGRPGGFVERLFGGTYFGHIIEHVSLELLTQVGFKANFGKTRSAGKPGLYDIIIEYESEQATEFVMRLAMQYVTACALGEPFALYEKVEEARRIKTYTELGPSTAAILKAAETRGIPARRIGQGSLLQLGTGKYRKFVQATMTEKTSAVAVDIAGDKSLTKALLNRAGISVPFGMVAQNLEEIRPFFETAHGPVVVKPLDGSQGRGVTIDIRDWKSMERAYQHAFTISSHVLVEEFAVGRHYRLLMVADKLVAASERIPAHIVGDGRSTVKELVDWVNAQPDRGHGHEKPLTKIPLDDVALDCLARQGRSLYDCPGRGETVYLRDSANLSTGGIALDVTGRIHPGFAAIGARCARAIGLDVCGVDLITDDIRLSPEESAYVVIEVNAAPGIRMHHYPSMGEAQDVAGSIVDSLYAKGSISRVPVISVTGTNGKTTTVRMIRHILTEAGQCVGLTTTEGVYVGDEHCLHGDTTGPQSAQVVLSDPRVEVAVLETARGGIQRGGLGYDAADVGIITNVAVDHLGQDGLANLEDILRVKSLVAECVRQDGIAVLNADDSGLVHLSGKLKAPIVYFSLQEQNPVVTRHLARGGTAFFVQNGWIVEAAGSLLWRIVKITELPVTLGGIAMFHVANALCACAASRHMGVSRQKIAEALAQFRSDTHNPGRINLFTMPNGTRVVSDYGHNPDGIRAVGEMAKRLIKQPMPAIIGFPGDRSDEVIRAAAKVAADYFYPLYIKEDGDTRGRRRGEVAALIKQAILETYPEKDSTVEYDECEALHLALNRHAESPFIFMFHEDLGPVRALLQRLGGVEVGTLDSQETGKSVELSTLVGSTGPVAPAGLAELAVHDTSAAM